MTSRTNSSDRTSDTPTDNDAGDSAHDAPDDSNRGSHDESNRDERGWLPMPLNETYLQTTYASSSGDTTKAKDQHKEWEKEADERRAKSNAEWERRLGTRLTK
jgi:hypothetical protein